MPLHQSGVVGILPPLLELFFRFYISFCKGLQTVSPPNRYSTTGALISSLLFLAMTTSVGCQSSTSYNNRGVRQFQQGDYQSALNTFQNAIASNPNDSDAYYNLAATLHDWGRRGNDANMLDQAESLYHRCLDLQGNHVDCHRALAVLLVDTDRRESAFTLLERWAQRSPSLSAPLVELARLNEEYGRDDTARQYLAQALDIDATSARAWAAMGRLREREGRIAQALTDYQHAYNINRNHPGIPQRIASLQQRLAQARSNPTARLGSARSSLPPTYTATPDLPLNRSERVTQSSDWVPRSRL